MAHDAEYAQREFQKRKQQDQNALEAALQEIRRLQETVTRLEEKVSDLRSDVKEMKQELHEKK